MRNAYVDLCLNIQAVRRHFEGIRTPLSPALGVKASIYTHQIANVLRVLTDIRVRHILADEVGLGKTVQALMILNALRFQQPDLKALVIVPDRLVPQWRDEIMTRAHSAPFDGNEQELDMDGGEQYIRLAWEDQLRRKDSEDGPSLALSDIDPSRYNILIVDELHRLRSDLQDRIVRTAGKFEHILILSATPAFQQIDRHAQLFAILEPERTALSRWRITRSKRGKAEQLFVGDDLSKWPEWAVAEVVDDFLTRDRKFSIATEDPDLTKISLAHCAYRRVLRTRRVDYRGVLPRRRHLPIVIEPLGAETDRQLLMWQYFEYLGELSTQFAPDLLAKRVILSPPSLEQRVDFLRRKGHERNGLLERVKPLVHQSKGDSRADALVDLLNDIWICNPRERVLVAAQDNLTVDYLFDLVQARLPEIGPLNQRVALVASRLRQGMTTEAVEDLGGFGNETSENLEAFQRGDAQVLFVPEAAQVGLNLQCARVLVLYSVPWKPEEVEQWIGRLDRIGNAAAFSSWGDANSIDVYTIVQRNLVDEKVVDVLQRFHVFERSVNLDGDHLEEVAKMIEDAALRPKNINWKELEEKTELMAIEDEALELKSELQPYLPWTVQLAKKEREYLDSLVPAPPVLRGLPDYASSGPKAWERAFEVILKLLKEAGDYHIRSNIDPDTNRRFQSLWYKFGDRQGGGQRSVLSKVTFSIGADPAHERSPRFAHAFITRRGDIEVNPRRSVLMLLNGEPIRRPLHYLSFGDELHDELIEGWLPYGDEPLMLDVAYPSDHEVWNGGSPGLHVVRISIVDPADTFVEGNFEEKTLELIAQAATRSNLEKLPELMRKFPEMTRSALDADIRWIRSKLTAKMGFEVRQYQGGHWAQVEAEQAATLLNPLAQNRGKLPKASGLSANKDIIEAAQRELNRLREADTTVVRSAWGHRLPDFELALQQRLLMVQEEGIDSVALAEEDLTYAQSILEVALDRGNRAQITRAENARDAAEDHIRMQEIFWQQRSRWLRVGKQELLSIEAREYLIALLHARKA